MFDKSCFLVLKHWIFELEHLDTLLDKLSSCRKELAETIAKIQSTIEILNQRIRPDRPEKKRKAYQDRKTEKREELHKI